MDVFVARQPIFDLRERVVGYELLHRCGAENAFSGIANDLATNQLLSEHLLTDGSPRLTGGLPAWVNFPADLLLNGAVTLVPPERMVVELLEDIVADDALLAVCRDLADRGYVLAADDVSDAADDNPLLDVAQIIKVDFRTAGPEHRIALARRFKGRARLLAEKVETRADQAQAVELGYELLQGYFLDEPRVLRHRALEQTRQGALSVLTAVSSQPMDFEAVERAIKQDLALTDKLLRYLNSAVFAWRRQIASIREALVALGEVQVRRWVTVVAVASAFADRPDELVVSALARARLCEQFGGAMDIDVSPLELFLTGLYSRMHLLMETDRETALADAPTPEPVRRALLDRRGPAWSVLQLVVAWELGDWEQVTRRAAALGVHEAQLTLWYAEALGFADTVRHDDTPAMAS